MSTPRRNRAKNDLNAKFGDRFAKLSDAAKELLIDVAVTHNARYIGTFRFKAGTFYVTLFFSGRIEWLKYGKNRTWVSKSCDVSRSLVRILNTPKMHAMLTATHQRALISLERGGYNAKDFAEPMLIQDRLSIYIGTGKKLTLCQFHNKKWNCELCNRFRTV